MVDALDDGLDVGENLASLLGDAALDHLAGGRVDRQLAGDVVVVREGDGLGGQRATRSGVRVVRLDDQAVTVLDGLRRGAVAVGADSLDLDLGVHRQRGDRDDGASRHVGDSAGDAGVREEAGVDLVDGVDVGQVGQEDVDLDDVVERHVDAREDGLDVLEALRGLLGDAAHDQLAGDRVDRELRGDVVVVGERHGLGGQGVERRVGGVVDVLDQVTGLRGVRNGALAVGDERLDLDERVHRQRVDGHHGAGRQVGREERAVHGVDDVHVLDIADEDGDADDVVQVMVDALNDGRDVAVALLGLLGDAASDDGAGGRVDGQLGRKVVVMRESDGLGAHRALRCVLRVARQNLVVTAHSAPLSWVIGLDCIFNRAIAQPFSRSSLTARAACDARIKQGARAVCQRARKTRAFLRARTGGLGRRKVFCPEGCADLVMSRPLLHFDALF